MSVSVHYLINNHVPLTTCTFICRLFLPHCAGHTPLCFHTFPQCDQLLWNFLCSPLSRCELNHHAVHWQLIVMARTHLTHVQFVKNLLQTSFLIGYPLIAVDSLLAHCSHSLVWKWSCRYTHLFNTYANERAGPLLLLGESSSFLLATEFKWRSIAGTEFEEMSLIMGSFGMFQVFVYMIWIIK